MLKSLLRSSVNCLVVLSVLINVSPSYAGNSGSGERPEGEEGIHCKPKKRIKQNKEILNFYDIATAPSISSGFFQALPHELTALILFLTDPQEVKSNRLVCKNWNSIFESNPKFYQFTPMLESFPTLQDIKTAPPITSGPFQGVPDNLISSILLWTDVKGLSNNRLVCKKWKAIADREANTTTKFTAQLVIEAHEIWSSKFPLVLGYPHLAVDAPSKYPQSYPDVEEEYQTVLSLLQKPYTYPFLLNHYLSLNPMEDYQEIAMAGWVIQQTPVLQERLNDKILQNRFDLHRFPELFQDPRKRPFLQHYLMGLHYLGRCGNGYATAQLGKFFNVFSDFLFDENNTDTLRFSQFLNFASFSPDYFERTAGHIGTQLSLLPDDICVSNFSTLLQSLPGFLTLCPTYDLYKDWGLFQGIQTVYWMNNHEPLDERAKAIFDRFSKESPKVEPQYLGAAEEIFQYISVHKYREALDILETFSVEETGNSFDRIGFLLNKSICILNLELKEKFPLVKEYLEYIAKKIEDLENYFYKNSEKYKQYQCCKNIYKTWIGALKAALGIFEGNFEEVFHYLGSPCYYQGNALGQIELSGERAILQASRTQLNNPKLPKNLLCFGDLEQPEWRDLVTTYSDVLEVITDKKAFKKMKKKLEKATLVQEKKIKKSVKNKKDKKDKK
jgi:hypothetical protein